ncbi:hypothetical protein LUZ60_003067 [Juncus effusus]|nr:hypothetical protein LUZ60_003067 [Juncus effusus]
MGDAMLGLPGQWAKNYHEKADHYTTKIGGVADWPELDSEVSEELVQCCLCGAKLFLVLQIYAPLKNIEERVIYLFACTKPECGNNPKSWRVLRVQKSQQDVEKITTEPSEEVKLEKDAKLTTNVFEESDEETDSDIDLDELAQELEKVSILASNSKKEKGPKHDKKSSKGPIIKQIINDLNTPVLPCFYIYCEKETKEKKGKNGANSDNLLSISDKEMERSSASETEEEKWEEEAYEYDKALNADRTYLKFKKYLDSNPEQCFRYCYGGNPILPTFNVAKPSACKICGSVRNYELQLMPPLLYFINEGIGDGLLNISLDGWTWLTIIVYTCPKNCSALNDGCLWSFVEEEAVIIQDD